MRMRHLRAPLILALVLPFVGCVPGRHAGVGSSRPAAPGAEAPGEPPRALPCLAASYLPPWACVPQLRPALRELGPGDLGATLTSGWSIPTPARLAQRAPIRWVPGEGTQVPVSVETPALWLRGTIPASQLRFALPRGTPLYSGPTGPQVGVLDGPLEAQPLAYRQGRVSFRYLTPHSCSSSVMPLLWAPAAAFHPDAKPREVPAAWRDRPEVRERRNGPAPTKASGSSPDSLPWYLVYRLDDQIQVAAEGARRAVTTVTTVTTVTQCAIQRSRVRLLEEREDRIRVVLRLVDGYDGRPGPVLLRGWVPLAPRHVDVHSPQLTTLCCGRNGYSIHWEAAYPAGNRVTTQPLPLYPSPSPDQAPVGMLAANAQVTVGPDTMVGTAPHRFLKVSRGALFYVPYLPTLVRGRHRIPCGRSDGGHSSFTRR